MSSCNYTTLINETECIGDSLVKINNNFSNLDNQLCNISTNSTLLPGLTSLRSQVTPTALFVPANWNTKSNSNVTLVTHQYASQNSTARNITPITTTTSLSGGIPAGRAWWSGAKTVTVTNVPVNTQALLVEVYYNVNAYANNGQSLYIRKNASETQFGWPSSGEGDITQAVREAFADSKISLDPTGSNNPFTPGGATTAFEAEHSATLVIYPDIVGSTTRSFQYCIVDNKTEPPVSFPDYYVRINLQGYYVSVS